MLLIFAENIYKMTKDVELDCILKSHFSAARLRDIVIGLKNPRRELITKELARMDNIKD
jgi:hypothetical protein